VPSVGSEPLGRRHATRLHGKNQVEHAPLDAQDAVAHRIGHQAQCGDARIVAWSRPGRVTRSPRRWSWEWGQGPIGPNLPVLGSYSSAAASTRGRLACVALLMRPRFSASRCRVDGCPSRAATRVSKVTPGCPPAELPYWPGISARPIESAGLVLRDAPSRGFAALPRSEQPDLIGQRDIRSPTPGPRRSRSRPQSLTVVAVDTWSRLPLTRRGPAAYAPCTPPAPPPRIRFRARALIPSAVEGRPAHRR
jgi:hypothetical protein